MGLTLVARLATAHGWMAQGGRKHVWARIDTSTSPWPSSNAVPSRRHASPSAEEERPTEITVEPASSNSSTTVPPNWDSGRRCG